MFWSLRRGGLPPLAAGRKWDGSTLIVVVYVVGVVWIWVVSVSIILSITYGVVMVVIVSRHRKSTVHPPDAKIRSPL